jgi:hypothetical protein
MGQTRSRFRPRRTPGFTLLFTQFYLTEARDNRRRCRSAARKPTPTATVRPEPAGCRSAWCLHCPDPRPPPGDRVTPLVVPLATCQHKHPASGPIYRVIRTLTGQCGGELPPLAPSSMLRRRTATNCRMPNEDCMTYSAAIIRRYKTREQVRGTWPREASDAPWRGGGTADGSGTSAATMAASGSRSGCRPRRAPHLSESIL